jgi:CDP-diacylglycerol--glycerol-3-phosphate 3-phosphatidyltransferase
MFTKAALPNLLTVLRLVLTLVMFACFAAVAWVQEQGASMDQAMIFMILRMALASFVIAAVTDFFDGWLARRWKVESLFGAILDPIADKVLIGAALVVLSMVGELPWWVTIVVLVREVGITVYRMLIVHREIHAASWGGKVKTTAQSIAASFALAPFPALLGDWMNWVNAALMTAALALTVWTGLEYVWKAIRA